MGLGKVPPAQLYQHQDAPAASQGSSAAALVPNPLTHGTSIPSFVPRPTPHRRSQVPACSPRPRFSYHSLCSSSSCLLCASPQRARQRLLSSSPPGRSHHLTHPSSSIPVDQRDNSSKQLFIETCSHPLHALHACQLWPWHSREEQTEPWDLFPAWLSPDEQSWEQGVPSLVSRRTCTAHGIAPG